MKKQYNRIEICLENCVDVIRTSGEYLETGKMPIGVSSIDDGSYNFFDGTYNKSSYNVP